ncbi:gfo/Idh/MocA family oxidoreductase [Arthrobacter psychrolactophilus]|uniref:Gfo/Idh/MocA family oxidoreductase n=2 Tax=Arthrobacter psychrolactophilus TaxID=92442 RepID=A0A2V5ISQ4_9MICC|nr:gfo/Idh/MocA family oxidoreductase [Arthrobacter psychrolactophilus]
MADVELVGVAEDSVSPAWMKGDSAKAAAAVGIAYFDSLVPLLDANTVDAVVVCSEPTRHAELAARALAAGLHVLVDKPIGVNRADIAQLAKAEATAVGTLSVINRLQSPAVQRLRRWVDAGTMGLPLHVDVEWFASGAHFATSVERPELVVDPSLSGGGELLNFLLYPVDYIRFLTGLEVVEVHCEASTLFSQLHEENGVEDCAIVSLLLENAVTATVTVGRVPAAPGLGPVSSSIRILGSHGNASSDDDKPQVSRYDTAGGISALPVGGPSSVAILRIMLKQYVQELQSGRTPTYGLHDAAASFAVIEAAYDSVKSGQPVRVSTAR